jgi:hypothetical protein
MESDATLEVTGDVESAEDTAADTTEETGE